MIYQIKLFLLFFWPELLVCKKSIAKLLHLFKYKEKKIHFNDIFNSVLQQRFLCFVCVAYMRAKLVQKFVIKFHEM